METPTGVAPGRKGVGHAGLKKSAVQGNGTVTNQKRKPPMKAKSSRFDSLVARYYPAVYSFASRLTDDPREAVVLTRNAFNGTRKHVRNRREEVALASILIAAVIRRVLPPLELKLTQCSPMRGEQNLKRLQQRRRTSRAFHYVQQCY
jgi:hypothetical protein